MDRTQILIILPKGLYHSVGCLIRKVLSTNEVDIVSPQILFFLHPGSPRSWSHFDWIPWEFCLHPPHCLRRHIERKNSGAFFSMKLFSNRHPDGTCSRGIRSTFNDNLYTFCYRADRNRNN